MSAQENGAQKGSARLPRVQGHALVQQRVPEMRQETNMETAVVTKTEPPELAFEPRKKSVLLKKQSAK